MELKRLRKATIQIFLNPSSLSGADLGVGGEGRRQVGAPGEEFLAGGGWPQAQGKF